MIRVTASIDDGSNYDSKVVRLFKEFDVPVTYYLTVNHVDMALKKGYEPLNPYRLKKTLDYCELGSHTINHPLLTRVSIEEAKDEIFESKRLLESMFNRKIEKFCYPRGYSNLEIQQLVKEAGYVSARSTLVGFIDKSENPYFEQTTLHAGCNRKEYGGRNWYEYGLKMLDKAKEQEFAYYHIWLHGWELERINGIVELRKLLKKLC